MYRNQLSLQQDARLHLQREALQQRQAELRSVDQRILELQIRPSNNVYPSQRIVPRANNVAAVEPYVHTPQKNSIPISKPAQHLIHDLTALKQLNQASNQASIVNHVAYAESDESKLARQKRQMATKIKDPDEDLTVTDFAVKKNDPKYQTLPYNTKFGTPFGAKTPSSASSTAAAAVTTTTTTVTSNGSLSKTNECDSEKAGEIVKTPTSSTTPSAVQKTPKEEKPGPKPKSLHQIPSGNLVVPPRKPISSVAPTTMIPKIVAHNPKVQMVAPSVNHTAAQQSGIPVSVAMSEADKVRPALPPKPNKSPPQSDTDSPNASIAVVSSASVAATTTTSAPTIVSMINKPPVTEPASSNSDSSSPVLPPPMGLSDNLPIKPKPLTIKKQPIHEQPKLRSNTGIKPVQYTSRRIEMPPAFLFPEVATAELKDKSEPPQSTPPVASPKSSPEESTQMNGSLDETDKSTSSSTGDDTVTSSENEGVQRRTRTISTGEGGGGKAKLARRVSFDPLALLLDASLEGELELVRKTAMQVTNPSAANDEGITALHNAICAGNDLDSIRALFSEKEKELSLAVAKVEALTRQLEDLRRDRRGPLNLIPGGGNPGGNQQQSAAARELDKLRRELMYRNQLSLQQDARLHLQREALQQRQAELRSVDQRILELQSRLQRKKASNLLLQTSQNPSPSPPQLTPPAATTQPLQNGTTATVRPSNNVYPSQRIVPRANNVAAVEPYVHTPQKNSIPISKPAQHLIHDLTALKQLNQASNQASIVNHVAYAESDESKLARQKRQMATKIKDPDEDLTVTDFAVKKNDPKYQTLPYNTKFGTPFGAKTPSSAASTVSAAVTTTTTTVTSNGSLSKTNECDSEKAGEIVKTPTSSTTPSATQKTPKEEKPGPKPKSLHQIPSGNLVVPPRKPISSVAPTTMIPKIVAHNPKVQMVAPSVNHTAAQQSGIPVSVAMSEADKVRPALPPKPNKSPPQSDTDSPNASIAVVSSASVAATTTTSAPTIVSMINKPPVTEPASSNSDSSSPVLPPPMGLSDNLPIKPKPLTIKKQPIHEQPKLRSNTGIKPVQYTSRRIEMPPAFLFPEVATAELKDKSEPPQSTPPVASPKSSPEESTQMNGSLDETDKSTSSSTGDDTVTSSENEGVQRRTRTISTGEGGGGKAKLARRVSFDPLALLLDASLEGELELVRKTAMQVTNPSAANDEGITALHNAICAGHLEIVKFLVEYGCDVNAQDSDGWTPLHCAASCNNLAMVKFLVESGACLFAATLSDHETPAEKCEEDEEGFDGCSEYLY
uniref:Putative apoptosis-stimulating of p53 protein 1 isoform x2 n=1 Tax=Lutzomyia longipalpis TaxID=7200 RepID=A0A1B0CAR1_LUTLO